MTKEYCFICYKDLTNTKAYSCDSEPCILEGYNWGLLCSTCANAHSMNTNHEVSKC